MHIFSLNAVKGDTSSVWFMALFSVLSTRQAEAGFVK